MSDFNHFFLGSTSAGAVTYLSSFSVIFKEKVQANKCIKVCGSPHFLSVTLCTHLSYTYKIALGVVADACIQEAEARGPLQVQGQHGTRS